jgi:mRNA interferase MazF
MSDETHLGASFGATPGPDRAAPERGHLIWADFEEDAPSGGRPAAVSRHPALVISPTAYNARTGLALVCAITSRFERTPFDLEIPPGSAVDGAVMADHVRCIDWRVRRAVVVGRLSVTEVREVIALVSALLGRDS